MAVFNNKDIILAALKGEKGEKGDKGDTGATIPFNTIINLETTINIDRMNYHQSLVDTEEIKEIITSDQQVFSILCSTNYSSSDKKYLLIQNIGNVSVMKQSISDITNALVNVYLLTIDNIDIFIEYSYTTDFYCNAIYQGYLHIQNYKNINTQTMILILKDKIFDFDEYNAKHDKEFIRFPSRFILDNLSEASGTAAFMFNDDVSDDEEIAVIVTCPKNNKVKGVRQKSFRTNKGNTLALLKFTKSQVNIISDLLHLIFAGQDINFVPWKQTSDNSNEKYVFKHDQTMLFFHANNLDAAFYDHDKTRAIFGDTNYNNLSKTVIYYLMKQDFGMDNYYAKLAIKFVRNYKETTKSNGAKKWEGNMANSWLEVTLCFDTLLSGGDFGVFCKVKPRRY